MRIAATILALACTAASGPSRANEGLLARPVANLDQQVVIPRGNMESGRSLFVRGPADISQVAAVIPLGNLNPPGGHVRPVKHMYLEYLTPRNAGRDSVDVNAMAGGEIVLVLHRQTEACVQPTGPFRESCASGPGATRLIDEYEVWVRHTDEVTSYYDHLHELDARLGLPNWADTQAGWVQIGAMRILVLGLNGARAPVRVSLERRLGATRNYSTAWDVGVVDTRRRGSFLGSGVLRYPSLPDFFAAYVREGGAGVSLSPDQPFPGEMFVNSACFIDYMTPRLAIQWRKKLAGDGSGGRPDWDVAGTLQGNWYRASVTAPTFANMRAIEEHSISLSPHNLDPANKVQIGIGQDFMDSLPPTSDSTEVKIRGRLSSGLVVTTETGTRHNPRPTAVNLGDYACYSISVESATYSLLVYHESVGGIGHLRLRYFVEPCTTLLSRIESNPAQLQTMAWSGDYVR